MNWSLLLASAGAWLICFLCLFKSLEVYGKISFFTGLFPYVVFFLLGARGLFLDGASLGLEYYLKPDSSQLWTINPWRDAAGELFQL
jgi:SNF family Na+-dependent transporter